jgi:hypothetical protein
MELAADTGQFARYSPTSTPVLDVLRPLASRKRDRVSAGEYFFLSSAFIITLIGLPWLRQAAASMSSLSPIQSLAVTLVAIPGAALAAALAVHEAGHLMAAWIAGFRTVLRSPRAFSSGDKAAGQLYFSEGVRFGPIALEPKKTEGVRRRLLLLVLAGPAANLLLPLALEAVVYMARLDFLVAFGIHVFSVWSLLVGVADLLPDVGKGSFSDGARTLMLLRNDAAAQRWTHIVERQYALAHGEHPRTWDEAAVTRDAALDDDSRDAVLARWLGYLWATERQDITLATKYLEEALAAPASSSVHLRDRLFTEAAMFQAWFRDDSAKARFWAAHIRMRRLSPLQKSRLSTGLLWSEGKLFDAWEKLGDYFYLLREMPASPARDLLEQNAVEWKKQMESRMLTRAWRTMYSMSREVEQSAPQKAEAASACEAGN